MNAIHKQPYPKRLWVYNGPGNGRGLVHLIIEDGQDEVVTWSLPDQAGGDGWSWQGNMQAFFHDFHPLFWGLHKNT